MSKSKRFIYILTVVIVVTVLSLFPIIPAGAESISNPGSLGKELDTSQFISLAHVGTVVPCFEFEVSQIYSGETNFVKYTVCGILGQYGDYGDENYYYNDDKIVIILQNTYTGSSTFESRSFWRYIERDALGFFSLTINSTSNATGWFTVGSQPSPMWQPPRAYFDNLDIQLSSTDSFTMNTTDTFIPKVTTTCKATSTTDVIKWSSVYEYGVSGTENIFSFSLVSISSTYASNNGNIYWHLPFGFLSAPSVVPGSTALSTYVTNRTALASDRNLSLYLGTGFYSQYHVDEAYDLGYQAGKSEQAEELTGFNVLSGALSSVMEVFNMKVFGYFSLGDVVSVVLVFGVVLSLNL